MCKQQRELMTKCSEVEKGEEEAFCVAVSSGEYCNLPLLIFSTEMFKMCALHHGHLAYSHMLTNYILLCDNVS
jgi:hypothetical protein